MFSRRCFQRLPFCAFAGGFQVIARGGRVIAPAAAAAADATAAPVLELVLVFLLLGAVLVSSRIGLRVGGSEKRTPRQLTVLRIGGPQGRTENARDTAQLTDGSFNLQVKQPRLRQRTCCIARWLTRK